MILVDTSAWVEYDRATGSAVDRRLTALIARGGPIAVTEPVAMEVLAGARDERRAADLRRLLLRFDLLRFDAGADFDAAVLACDRDFARMARVIGVDLDEASLPGRGPH